MTKTWKELAAEKKQKQADSIPKEWLISAPPSTILDVTKVPEECGLLSSKELEITGSAFDILSRNLASGAWTAVEVTIAFYKRAIIAHQVTNCLTEIFIDRALKRAGELDDRLKETGKVVGPLHGIPISLKDQICIEGLETTMGYVSWIGKHANHNAVIVDILLAAGAIPFVRTNVPQTLMWPETFNMIFGRTVNPFNRSLTSGGSSGGEGALIALKGSPLGVGTDVGGSVRIPAALCGIYALRPSYNRLPYARIVNSLDGQDSIPSVIGPMSGSLAGIKAFTEAVINQKPWLKDPAVLRKCWDEAAYRLAEHGGGKGLCFAVMWDDGITVPHPPIIRGLQFTKDALIAAGHKVIDWYPLNHDKLCAAIGGIWNAGASEDYRVTIAPTNEPLIVSMVPDMEISKAGDIGFRPENSGISAYELWQIQKEKRDLRQNYLDHWEKTVEVTGTGRPVDAIISPAAAYAAPPHGYNRNADYTMVWNILDYAALAIPVSNLKVDKSIDLKKPRDKFLNDIDKNNYESYDPDIFDNAPISIQLVGRTQEEEAVIGMAEIVDAAIKRM